MRRFVREQDWPYPYLHDESQDVARALGAEVTPHVFVLDGEQRLAYRGAPDADHRDPAQDAAWLRGALDAVLDGRAGRAAPRRGRAAAASSGAFVSGHPCVGQPVLRGSWRKVARRPVRTGGTTGRAPTHRGEGALMRQGC